MKEENQLEELSIENSNIKNIDHNMNLTKIVENSEKFFDKTDFSNSDDKNNKDLRQKRSINYLENLSDNDFDKKSIKAKRIKSIAENNNQSNISDFNNDFRQNLEIKVDNCLENRSGSEIVLQMCQDSVENTDLSENVINGIDDGKKAKKTLKYKSKIDKNLIILNSRRKRSKSIFKDEKLTEYFFNLDKIDLDKPDLKNKAIIKRSRGRPKKNSEHFINENKVERLSILNENNQKSIINKQKKVRGRPKKIILSNNNNNNDLNQSLINGEVKRSRGRPRAIIIDKIEDNINFVDENKSIKSIKIETEKRINSKQTRKIGKSIKNSDLIENQLEIDNSKLNTKKMLKIDKKEKIDNAANNNNLSAHLQSLKELAELEEQYRKLQEEHKSTKEALRKSELLYKESAKKKRAKIE